LGQQLKFKSTTPVVSLNRASGMSIYKENRIWESQPLAQIMSTKTDQHQSNS